MPKVTLGITELHEILVRDYLGGLGRQRDKNKQGAGLAACKQVLDFDWRGVEGKGQKKSSSPDHWLLGLLAGDLFLGCLHL